MIPGNHLPIRNLLISLNKVELDKRNANRHVRNRVEEAKQQTRLRSGTLTSPLVRGLPGLQQQFDTREKTSGYLLPLWRGRNEVGA